MSQHDYEQQPESPDLGEYVQEDPAETLVGPAGSDPLDAGYVPPDRPYLSADDPSLSGRSESLEGRLDRERPDVGDPSYRPDTEADRAPRLQVDEPTADSMYTEGTDARDVGVAGGAASAEEAAVHEMGDLDRRNR